MDLDPERRELSMARWTLAGGIGVLAGPLGMLILLPRSGGTARADVAAQARQNKAVCHPGVLSAGVHA
jgi:hypothetical protein